MYSFEGQGQGGKPLYGHCRHLVCSLPAYATSLLCRTTGVVLENAGGFNLAAHRGGELQERPAMLPVRGLGSILDETFAVYSRRFITLLLLVAVIEVPASFLVFGIHLVLGGGKVAIIVTSFVGVLGGLFVYSAMTFAIGQQYLTGHIDVLRSYSQAWGRVATIVGLATINIAFLLVLAGLVQVSTNPLIAPFILIFALAGTALAVYCSSTIQVMTVEKYKMAAALKRSSQLIAGSWLRVLGIKSVLMLVMLGLGIVVTLPFTVLLGILSVEPFSTIDQMTMVIMRPIVKILVLPVWFIAGTLIYYDLRVRRETYSLDTLSRDMGIASA